MLGSATAALAQSAPTVNLRNGVLQGAKCPTTNVNSFLGIPYAQPPVDTLRFAPPLPYNQTFASMDATSPSAACIQFNDGFAESGRQSEDCLFINVWVPANATADSNLPVKVWLYGGSNQAGSISDGTYDGCSASESVIMVSINYRVGPLGFLNLKELGLTGNQGLQDQLLGLQWVKDNVGAFGGDAKRVLLFGQSAGAQDTFVISSLPQAPSLISAAILQSALPGNLSMPEDLESQNQELVKALNCSTSDIACVRRASVSAIQASYRGRSESLGLILDGTVIATQPLEAGLKVPAIAGTTTNEGSLFILSQYQAGVVNLNATTYNQYLAATFGSLAQRVNETYPLANFANAFDAISTVLTHRTFRCPTRAFLRQAVQDNVPVYTYSFNHTLTCPWYNSIPVIALELLGSTHTAEIPFVMGGTDSMPRPNGTCSLTAGEKALSAKMLAAWNSMAMDASPGVDWPRYDGDGSMGINVVGDEFAAGQVDYSMCDFWDEILIAMPSGGNVSTRGGTADSGQSTTSNGMGLESG
ncbi:unnamed protein product [Discula destructiva]